MTRRKQKQPQCAASTVAGNRCANAAKTGSDCCGAHDGNVGQPTILPSTPYGEDQTYGTAIAGLIRLGLRRGPAARRLRLAPATVERWVETGEADIENGKQSEFVEFVLEIEMARVAIETDALQTIHNAIKGTADKPGDASVAFKMLERIRPEDWSPTHRLEHSGSVNLVEQHAEQLYGPLSAIFHDLELTDEQWARVPDLIEQHFSALEQSSADE